MRAIEKKRPPLISKKQWIVLISFFVIAIVVALAMFYRSIQLNHWNEKNEITAGIQAELGPFEIEYQEKYIWESPVWIVRGRDNSNELFYYAWQNGNILASEPVSQTITEEQMLEKVRLSKPNADKVKIIPGYAWDMFIWEVHYYETELKHYQYAFYTMSDGNFITEYTLPNKEAAN